MALPRRPSRQPLTEHARPCTEITRRVCRASRRGDDVSEIKLAAKPRTEFGKGAARRLRRADQIPAVLYGHGAEPVHVALEGHATMLALKHSNALISLDIE